MHHLVAFLLDYAPYTRALVARYTEIASVEHILLGHQGTSKLCLARILMHRARIDGLAARKLDEHATVISKLLQVLAW